MRVEKHVNIKMCEPGKVNTIKPNRKYISLGLIIDDEATCNTDIDTRITMEERYKRFAWLTIK